MTFPLAVSPSVRSPGLYLLVNMLAAASSPGTGALRGLLIASKSSVGTITADTELKESVAGPDAVKGFCGPGTPGHLAAKAIFAEHPRARLDLVAPLEAAGVAASATVTFDDTTPVTVAQTFTLDAMGREIQIVWAAGETDIQAATKLVAAIAAMGDDLPFTGANGSGTLAVVTMTWKLKGTMGNDTKIAHTFTDGVGGAVVLSGSTFASGTTEANIANVLALVAGREYDYILLAHAGNTDSGTASATTGPGRLKTHIDGLDQGANAKLQQGIVGVTGSISNVKTGAAQHNYWNLQYVFFQNARSLPCEFGGAEMGARLRDRAIDPAMNRIRKPYVATLYVSKDLVGDALTEAENEDLLQSGVTPGEFDDAGNARPNRPITTYFKDGNGAADGRILDVSNPDGVYEIAKDLRTNIPRQFPQAKLSPDLGVGEEELPEGVTEVGEVREFIISRLRFWQKRGVARKDKVDEAIGTPQAPGSLIARVNPSDASQCDLVVPTAIVPPLAKFSLVVQKVA